MVVDWSDLSTTQPYPDELVKAAARPGAVMDARTGDSDDSEGSSGGSDGIPTPAGTTSHPECQVCGHEAIYVSPRTMPDAGLPVPHRDGYLVHRHGEGAYLHPEGDD